MAHAKGISIHFTGREAAGSATICIEGTATSGDVGVTGKPIWDVAYEDYRNPKGDIKTHNYSMQLECGLSDLPEVLSENMGSNVKLDF